MKKRTLNSLFRLIAVASCFATISIPLAAQSINNKVIVVDTSGRGDFKSIQDAINSLPQNARSPRIIYIKNGVYHEKIFIDKNFVSLIGEDRNLTKIEISLAREIWRCENKDDWGSATLNLKGNDLDIENLTITNRYGLDHVNDKDGIHIDCPGDSLQNFKTIQKDGHQMALRSFGTTRLKVFNCILRAYGGDTVSPWNTDNGQFYFKDCLMEGGVDLYCPRGWAYAENCTFIAHGNVAAIWHDGSKFADSKTVLKNCVFTGDDGFKLGRFHRDAQFYLINCSFAGNMGNSPIYLNPSKPQNIIQWGYRVYLFNCHRDGGDYAWQTDNLQLSPGNPSASIINAAWTFGGRWSPSDKPTKIDFKQIIKRGVNDSLKMDGVQSDPIAEHMLIYQRAIGGWPKAVNEVKVDYSKQLTEAERKVIVADSMHIDATIDNQATSREIRYLIKAYKQTKNIRYLQAAEKGLRYLLAAQYANGGWPQYYPDSALYRSQITYNDDAMINVLNILQDVVEHKNDFDLVDTIFIAQSKNAVNRGISCILRTQILVNGKLTAWCAQYNKRTFQPEMARKFELVSISGSESVGIVRFLMRINNPSVEIKLAIRSAVNWFKEVKIEGYKYLDISAPNEPKGKDRVILPQVGSTIWARFYEIGTNRPFFSGRSSIKKYAVSEIEYERRNGYAWYGTWPEKLLNSEYPSWELKNP